MKIPLIPKNQWTKEIQAEVACLEPKYKELVPEHYEHPDPESYFYHYTRAHTLKAILSTQKIRLYDILGMEDKEEFEYPLRVVWKLIQRYGDGLLSDMVDLFNPNRPPKLGGQFTMLAACFCQAAESPFMWQNYADRFRGASIRINAAEFANAPEQPAVFPMVYDLARYEGVVDDFLAFMVSRNWANRLSTDEGRTVAFEACLWLLRILFVLKRESFCEEREWRALMLECETPDITDDRGRCYCEIPLRPEYVSEVSLGSGSDLKEEEIKDLLQEHYPNTSVSRSTCR